MLQDVYVEGLSPGPQVELLIDREKAAALGVTFEDVNNTISANLGSAYINDFPNRGRMQRVVVQSDKGGRMQAEQILTYGVRNSRGLLVPMSSFAAVKWATGPAQIVGFNYYPSVRISGAAKPGYTAGDAIAEMERLTAQLPRGFGYEWAGQSLQEKLSGSQAPLLLALVGVARVSVPCGAVRELDHPAGRAADDPARCAGRRDRGDAARHAE